MKHIGIIGSRRRDEITDFQKLDQIFAQIYRKGDVIVSGGCPKGGDRFAEILAACLHIKPIIHYPDTTKLDQKLLQKNPRAAYARINYARNGLIARDADILIAIVADDRRGGTEDTIRKFCRKFGKTEKQLVAEGKLVLV